MAAGTPSTPQPSSHDTSLSQPHHQRPPTVGDKIRARIAGPIRISGSIENNDCSRGGVSSPHVGAASAGEHRDPHGPDDAVVIEIVSDASSGLECISDSDDVAKLVQRAIRHRAVSESCERAYMRKTNIDADKVAELATETDNKSDNHKRKT